MSRPEDKLCNEIMAKFGAEPGTLILRNIVAYVHPVGQPQRVMLVGLGEGSPDLLVSVYGCLGGCELKTPGKKPEPHQVAVMNAWARLGIHTWVAHTVDEFEVGLNVLREKARHYAIAG